MLTKHRIKFTCGKIGFLIWEQESESYHFIHPDGAYSVSVDINNYNNKFLVWSNVSKGGRVSTWQIIKELGQLDYHTFKIITLKSEFTRIENEILIDTASLISFLQHSKN